MLIFPDTGLFFLTQIWGEYLKNKNKDGYGMENKNSY